jgi:hypothetical protein
MASLTFTGGVAIFQLSGIEKSGNKIEREVCVGISRAGQNFSLKKATHASLRKKK